MSRTLRMNHLDHVISEFLFSNHSVCTFWHNNGLIFACDLEERKDTPSATLLFLRPDQQHSRAIQRRLSTEKTHQDIGRHMWQQHVPTRNYSSAWKRRSLLARVTATHAASFLGQRRATGNGSLSIAILSALRKSLSDQKHNRCAARLIRKKLLATVHPASDRATHCCFLASKVLTLLFKTSAQISQIPVFLKIFSPASVTN